MVTGILYLALGVFAGVMSGLIGILAAWAYYQQEEDKICHLISELLCVQIKK